jgi:hypothetical protein
MNRNALLLTVGVLAALSALPGMAQPRPRPAPPRTSVIAIQVNVDAGSGRPVTYGVAPNSETVPLAVGQSVRVSLVGTAIVNNVGVERPIRARFHLASGSSGLELGQGGSNWVTVRGRGGRGNGLAQLAYDVADNDYTMREGFLSGRITFQLAGGNAGPGPTPGPPGGNRDERFAAAERITQTLYRAILRQEDMRARRVEDDTYAIDRGGFQEIQQVARNLATQAEANGLANGRNATDVVARLYRELLHRSGDEREIAAQDSGFRDNVRALRERGLVEVVRIIVGSQEFQRVQELDRYGLLYVRRGGEGDRDRRDHDRRPPVR